MKMKSLLGIMLSLGILQSCQNDETNIIQNEVNNKGITFSSIIDDAQNSRAYDTSWEANDVIGVFMLANSNVLARNIPYATSKGDGYFVSKNSPIYYPEDNSAVDFIAYYPYSETLAETSEPSRYCRVTYPEIGTIDILWAKDTAETTDEGITGFNARYVRAVRTNPDGKGGLPHLEFQHVLTALTFSVKAAGDAELSNVVFRGIKLTNIQKGATLMIADRYKGIEGYVTSAGEKGDIPLKRNDSDNGDYQVIPQVDPTALSGTLMVVPAASYTAEISLTISGEARTIPVTLQREGDFEAGKKYSLTLAIMNPETVSITSELIPWEPVDGGEIVIGD